MQPRKSQEEAAWDAYKAACKERDKAWEEYKRLEAKTKAAQKREDAAFDVWRQAMAAVSAASADWDRLVQERQP